MKDINLYIILAYVLLVFILIFPIGTLSKIVIFIVGHVVILLAYIFKRGK
ncbi:hypothetical protein TUM17377_23520 [Shewanella chilikensis]|nr:hypothetical protein TUM17377_23520 [Shewanella chilikensis]